jgi:hypothetical protein
MRIGVAPATAAGATRVAVMPATGKNPKTQVRRIGRPSAPVAAVAGEACQAAPRGAPLGSTAGEMRLPPAPPCAHVRTFERS